MATATVEQVAAMRRLNDAIIDAHNTWVFDVLQGHCQFPDTINDFVQAVSDFNAHQAYVAAARSEGASDRMDEILIDSHCQVCEEYESECSCKSSHP